MINVSPQDVSSRHLELLLSYMYRGEINCEEEELLTLIATARSHLHLDTCLSTV